MYLIINLVTGVAKAFKYWQVLAFFVLIQILSAWLLAFPMTATFDAQLNQSIIETQLQEQDLSRALIYDEVLIDNNSFLSSVYKSPLMIVSGLSFLFFSMLVVSGALPLYGGLDLKFNWDRFWTDVSRYFKPFIGLALISLILFLIVDNISIIVTDFVNNSLRGSNDEATVFISTVVFTYFFRFFLFSLVIMVFQYAKIAAAAEQLRNIIYLVRKAFVFVGRYFVQALVLFILLGLLEFGIICLDHFIWYYVLKDSSRIMLWGWVIVSTVLFAAIKMSYFACQMEFYMETKRLASESSGIRISSTYY